MLPLEIRKYLFDIQEACELLVEFTEGKFLDDYLSDPMLRSAVERQFEIIGEAVGQMLKRKPDLSSSISNHQRIIAFRNLLVHGYADIAHDVVWGVLETNLPQLRHEVGRMLSGGNEA